MSKMQPMETAPKDRPVLVKHMTYGWVEASFDGSDWITGGVNRVLQSNHILAWAELPWIHHERTEEDK